MRKNRKRRKNQSRKPSVHEGDRGDSGNKSEAKGDSDNHDKKWWDIFDGAFHRLNLGGYVANFFVSLSALLVGPLAGVLMNNKKVMVYGAAGGITVLLWIGAWAIARELDEKPAISGEAMPAKQTDPAYKREHRAYLFIDKLRPNGPLIAGQPIWVTAACRNTGKTPAVDVASGHALCIGPNTILPESDKLLQIAQQTTRRIAVGATDGFALNIGTKNDIRPTEQMIVQIRNRATSLYAVGVVVYKDIFGDIHHTYFCAEYLPMNGEFEASAVGRNDID